ncbi:fungal trichothecene efflux pump [Coniochaeta sp. 2T2.1]|nr:fungal trichothecene efflux pump [Coniochaeta sp. 2T2.1]
MANPPSIHESGSVHTEPKQGLDNDSSGSVDGAVKIVHADGFIDYVDNKAIGGDSKGMPKGYFRSPAFLGTVTAQCFGSIVAYLGWVLPANTLTLINADLGNSPDINWVATVWTLGSCIGFLIVGRMSDIFGRKWMVQSSMALSLVGCIIGCLAKSVNMLIAANLLNGLAAAGQLSFGIVMGELVPNRLRGPVVTFIFLSSLPFAVFGPVIARLFIDNTAAKWRWSYYLGIIFSGLTMILYQFFYHPPTYDQLHVQGKTKWQQFKELDFIGILLFIAGCVLFLIGLSWGGQAYPWVSAPVLCTIIIGIFTLAGFVVYEGYFCKTQPFMPPRLFKNIGFDAIVIIAAVGAMLYYSLTVLWPQIISALYETDSITVGIQSSVVGGGILLGQVLGGFAITYVPKVKIQTICAACLTMAFLTPLVLLNANTHTMVIALGTMTCIAIGYIDNIAFPGVTLVFEPQDIGLATGVLGSIRALGGAVAQALYVSVYVNKLTANIPKYVAPAVIEAGLPESSLVDFLTAMAAGDFSGVEGVTDAVLAAVGPAMKVAYSKSFSIVFYCTIPFSVILIAASCLVPNMEKFLHNNVAKRLQGKNTGVEREIKPGHSEMTVPGRGPGQLPKEMIAADVQTVEKVEESKV